MVFICRFNNIESIPLGTCKMWLLYASGFYIQLVFRTGLTVINKLLLYLYYQISPQQLVEQGLSLCRTVQPQGHFVVVFPQAFTSSVCCGYNIAESLHFATHDWIQHGCKAAKVSDRSSMTTKFSGSRRKYGYQCCNVFYWLQLFKMPSQVLHIWCLFWHRYRIC